MNISKEKVLFILVVLIILAGAVLGIFIYLSYTKSTLTLTSPVGGEKLEIGKSYKITWKASGISHVGIAIFKEKDAKWIAKNVTASKGEYSWDIYPGQEYGSGFWIAVFEYPWKAGNKVSYSHFAFNITYPLSSGCESFSLQNDWLYFPSDYPELRRVFITRDSYSGNLGGLEGADKICQQEATSLKLTGTWQAFLGGDVAGESAMERLNAGPRKSDGVFVSAQVAGTLINGLSCHRFLGNGFNGFLNRFSSSSVLVGKQSDKTFMENISGVWIGRIDDQSRNNCSLIQDYSNNSNKNLREKYSYTVTCQGWSQDIDAIPNPDSGGSLPSCYTSQGKYTNAIGIAGLATAKTATDSAYLTYSQGSPCGDRKKLICVEE